MAKEAGATLERAPYVAYTTPDIRENSNVSWVQSFITWFGATKARGRTVHTMGRSTHPALAGTSTSRVQWVESVTLMTLATRLPTCTQSFTASVVAGV